MNQEEIKVGDYIRKSSGTIAKLKRIEFDKVDTSLKLYWYDKKEFGVNIIKEWCTNKPYIVKYSPNIIDLIEQGDYVNGKLVSNVDKVEGKNFIEWEDGNMYSTEIPNDKFIKDIVTKEQFEQIRYIVGE